MLFNLSNEAYFSPSGGLIPAGTQNYRLPDGEQPSRRWTPLDDEAREAIQKLQDNLAKRKALQVANVQLMTPDLLERLIQDRVAAVLEAKLSASKPSPASDPKKGPKKDDQPRAHSPSPL